MFPPLGTRVAFTQAARVLSFTLRLKAALLGFHLRVRLSVNRAVLLAATGASFLPFVHI